MLPDALDPSDLRFLALVALGVVVILALLIARLVQKMVLKVVLIGFLAGVGVYVWSERAALDDCRTDCACSFAGFDVDLTGLYGCPPPS